MAAEKGLSWRKCDSPNMLAAVATEIPSSIFLLLPSIEILWWVLARKSLRLVASKPVVNKVADGIKERLYTLIADFS